jgi:ubiquinone/menaquinone biosynthesis C-methylase UbiE
MLTRSLKHLIAVPSVSLRSYVRRSSWDLVSSLRHEADDLVPPNRLLFDGSENQDEYRSVGREFLGYLVELAGLKPTDAVLDVGCGIGRMAAALTTALGREGSYDGFDIVPIGIRWCKTHIQSRHPNFRFQHADIFNSLYNPSGKLKASEYRFPYPDESFDLVMATSVFTHMLPHDVESYFAEIARVLKPGGRCLTSWLLRTPEAEAHIRDGKSLLQFGHAMDGYWTETAATPEGAISYLEPDVMALLKRHRFELMPPIHYGFWCGRSQFLTLQDLVVARKETS